MTWNLHLFRLLSLLSGLKIIEAAVWFNSTASLPSNVTSQCLSYSSLQTDIACDSSLQKLRPFIYYPQSYLAGICTTSCGNALHTYESQVATACAGQEYDSLTGAGNVPIVPIPQLLRYSFNFSCLADSSSGQYCKVLAAAAAGISIDQSNLGDSDTASGGNSSVCSDCHLKALQFQAGSPFFAAADVTAAYRSATSSCQASGYPLTTSTLGFTV